MTGITVLVVVAVLAVAVGLILRRRSGAVRTIASTDSDDLLPLLVDAGVTSGAPTILHFSADWCGPCAAVRRVVHQLLADRTDAREVELDIDAHPVLARELGVLSLPTTFVLDGELRRRSRIAGVPSAAALREALDAL
ncbi:thioredoxin family protein [Rhodococcoides fascians]|uniref:thioredoxin family protein n=1 Tax=Rhodococcoides fascians TaxID=1828 RepID=UPI00050CB48B|nr:thioredoxin family protein [Rhodococcus fascians]AMY52122.1 Thioredoxin [Rhodococcus fascians D188]